MNDKLERYRYLKMYNNMPKLQTDQAGNDRHYGTAVSTLNVASATRNKKPSMGLISRKKMIGYLSSPSGSKGA